MARQQGLRLAALTASNLLLIPLAVLVFATGFFPYKPVLPGLATFRDGGQEEYDGTRTGYAESSTAMQGVMKEEEAVFDRVVFMVVDALRSDFVYAAESGFDFVQSLIRSGAAIPFTAHASPPTVTMPRVKALTTGSVPSFLDLILNFAESDTSSSLAAQDTWLAQIKATKGRGRGGAGEGGRIVFYGDDTWLKLFPGADFFARADGTSSFFVSDFTQVDTNVTRHVAPELARPDWDAMVMHYLGLDHIGHKTGPNGPNMLPKQREMDGIVRLIYEAMETLPHHARTLLVVAGDHGMNAGGNHGGSAPGETEPALLFASPLFRTAMREERRREYECPTLPKEGTEFHYYTKVEQSDIVPVLAGLLGFPISKNSLGVFLPEMEGILPGEEVVLRHLRRNARQMVDIVRAKYGAERFDSKALNYKTLLLQDSSSSAGPEGDVCRSANGDEDQLACEWSRILSNPDSTASKKHLYTFLTHAQETLSDTASSYDIPRMIAGMALILLALLTSLLSFPALWPPSPASAFLALLGALYALMMFASSYVEEEQHFWYWLTPAWIVLLVAKKSFHVARGQRTRMALAGAVLLCTHRVAVRWNQTGQKHAGDDDIVHAFFPEHHIVLWLLILSAYIFNGTMLHQRTFEGILPLEMACFLETTLVTFAVVFKLNFAQADAPELVRGLGEVIRAYSEPFSLVLQARAAFAVIAGSVVVVALGAGTWARWGRKKEKEGEEGFGLSERLHHLLTLFLMMQTRAPNIPLFLVLEAQRRCLQELLSSPVSSSKNKATATTTTTSPVEVATSALLLSNVFYFCLGGSNSISSIDLSNAYNGVADYNITAVGVLLFASNWTAPIWWCSAAVLLLTPQTQREAVDELPALQEGERDWVMVERAKLHSDAVAAGLQKSEKDQREEVASSAEWESWWLYVSCMTVFVATSLLAVMAACTALRTHLFIWTVFSPKYLYAMAWAVGWHLIVNVGLGSVLVWLTRAR